MHPLDRIVERSSRRLAQRTSRRGFVALLGQALTGSMLLPLLPIDRASRAAAGVPEPPDAAPPPHQTDHGGKHAAASDDPQNCQYWKYCAIDGFLCSCCGGSSHSCPPGTSMSPITWIGTCHNPGDGRDYMVSYNDCCGKTSCGSCECNRNERERPLYRLSRNNDINWCMANSDSNYHCSVSVIMGLAEQ